MTPDEEAELDAAFGLPPRQPVATKPAHRQAPPKPSVKPGTKPWWATAKREGFTATGAKATEASSQTPVARTIRARANEL